MLIKVYYIGQKFFQKLLKLGIKIITHFKRNAKNKKVFQQQDKYFLKKRSSFVETAFNTLKNFMNIQHTRHRSLSNFITNTIAALVAYNFKYANPKFNKNSIDMIITA